MRTVLIAALAAGTCACVAGEPLPVGFTRGNVLSVDDGWLAVRRTDGAIYECGYDGHTLFQRNRWPIQAGQLAPGEFVEVLSDQRSGARTCYTRMLSVVLAPAVTRRAIPGLPRERTPLRGSMTLAGLVTREDGSSFTVKTRDGERTLRLRMDTSFSRDGIRLAAPAPLVNEHVFIRAGRGMSGALEAYQIMWGEILNPPR